ncbi:RNA polymerase sigma factor [Acidipila rosea]|uniref:RNA polymerase sigma-70 factor (ECF subfamily) n=1 Tax=Acidipila rosea TaxID=768535 RepID=A0A4R1L2A4_9BACT|nr:sigma-70 family RNA polymerase sigma factor [Acidipila rosea]MBW4027915.1 sigma-70 family RNA polymerase sigma factor [Acidobacteriota bacterium]MBW4045288.1 sigma-70 family RNA polymerase sigma factor [Acidobacteriota bacterium]TCK72126.1 RNA polymerase sigma-70 factor (ECF subfamily) [Acidipila rosea]
MEEIAITDAQLLPQAALLNAANFDEVFRLYSPRVFRFLLGALSDRDAAETLTQECFLKAHLAADGFRGESSLQTWLMKIAVNLLRDHLRSQRFRFWRRAQSSALDPAEVSDWLADRQSSPEAACMARDQVAGLWSAVARLPAKQRTVFVLRFIEDMELQEIAANTGMQLSTVKTHLYRATAKLREQLKGGL